MEGHRSPLCVLRHLVSVVEVGGQGRLLVFVHQVGVGGVCSDRHGQETVNDDICVPEQRSTGSSGDQRSPEDAGGSLPPDGRGEVCVDGRGEAVVVKVGVHAGAEVDGLHHAARGQDPQQRVEVEEAVHAGLVQGVGQRLGRVRVDLYALMEKGPRSPGSSSSLVPGVSEPEPGPTRTWTQLWD